MRIYKRGGKLYMGLFDSQPNCSICKRPVREGKVIDYTIVCTDCAKKLGA